MAEAGGYFAEDDFSFRFESVIRGHHIYKDVWVPFIGEILRLGRENNNEQDHHAVAVLKDNATVGHAPREISTIFFYFLGHDGTIEAEVAGHRQYGVGLEVPCWYILTGKPKFIKRAKKLLKDKTKSR